MIKSGTAKRFGRIIAAALCAALVVVCVLSSVYILANSLHYHDFDGADGACLVCERLFALSFTIKTIAAVGVILCVISASVLSYRLLGYAFLSAAETPVRLRVRVNA